MYDTNKMRFVSTDKSDHRRVSFADTIINPIPSAGHLWMPEVIPQEIFTGSENSLEEVLFKVLRAYLSDLGVDLEMWARKAAHGITTPILPFPVSDSGSLTEYQLWHGPSGSFKDLGCRLVAQVYTELFGKCNYRILAATTGDTGNAIAKAAAVFQGCLPVTILYPEGQVYDKHEQELTNVSDPNHRVVPIAVQEILTIVRPE